MHGTPLFLFPPYQKPPSNALRQRRNAKKTAEERFNMLARGWLAYPVTPMHPQLPPKSGCRNHIPRLANNLYNRSSAVDPLRHNQPQVGKPTWGYDYTTALRRLPHPSSAISKNAIRPSVTIPKNRPSSSVCANGAMRKKPPKSGCRNHIPRFAILVLFDYFRNKMFYELHRCIIPHRFFDKRPRSHS